MATPAPATAKEVEIFRHNARNVHKTVQLNVDGLTHEKSLIQPQPGGNCVNWVVGHLLWVYDGMLPMLGQTPTLGRDALKRYARGTPPLHDSAEALNFRELVSAWNEVAARIDTGLGTLTTQALDAPAPYSPAKDPNETVRSLLSLTFFHQAYHAGQTGVLRRIVGREGAIR